MPVCLVIGAAWVVNHLQEGKKYVAKKVILEGLSAKEQENCMLEVNLLKNLDHPNIVAYKESFLTPGMMIIIMEYCDGKLERYLTVFVTLYLLVSRRHRLSHQEEAAEE